VFAQDAGRSPTTSSCCGFRYDWYTTDSLPLLNPNFVARNGFTNQTTYDGRARSCRAPASSGGPPTTSAAWPASGVFRGRAHDVSCQLFGAGPGNAGSPDIDIRRNTDGYSREFTSTPASPGDRAAALNVQPRTRASATTSPVVTAFQGGGRRQPLNEVASLSPDFELPSDWKFFVSGQWEVFDDWRLGLDVVATQTQNSLLIRDTRARPLVINGQRALLPDGRVRYDAINATDAVRAANGVSSLAAVGGNNRDLVIFNADEGEALTTSFSVSKRFDFGLDLFASYTIQNLEDLGSAARFASTSSSTYQSPAGEDPNYPAFGPGYDEVDSAVKLDLSYEREFIRDLPTRVTLFAEGRSGRKTTFTMGDATTGRGPVFGVNRGTNHLLYVPNIAADTDPTDLRIGNVFFDSANTRDGFLQAVDRFDLPQNAIVPKGYYKNDSVNQVDMQLSQRIPLPFGTGARVVFDIQNVLNLINDDWGIVEEFFDVNNVVNVACVTETGANPSAANPFACPAYRYSNFNSNSLRETVDTNGRSFWAIQIGLRFEF
jgi:hypothetical protein